MSQQSKFLQYRNIPALVNDSLVSNNTWSGQSSTVIVEFWWVFNICCQKNWFELFTKSGLISLYVGLFLYMWLLGAVLSVSRRLEIGPKVWHFLETCVCCICPQIFRVKLPSAFAKFWSRGVPFYLAAGRHVCLPKKREAVTCLSTFCICCIAQIIKTVKTGISQTSMRTNILLVPSAYFTLSRVIEGFLCAVDVAVTLSVEAWTLNVDSLCQLE